MTIYNGSLNATALIVPDLSVVILPPDVAQINGVPANILGIVGTASWGPKNAPTVFASMADYARLFGPIMARKYDLGTAVAAAVLQGANNFRGVRVTDGNDLAATITVQSTCLTITSKYTGSRANGDTLSIAPGSQVGTFKAIVLRTGLPPEIFDNIGLGLTANALWIAIAAAINNGNGVFRGPSDLIIATAGAGTTAPATATYTLAGGTDGASSIITANLVGVDTTPRTGMYALRGAGCAIAMLTDMDDTASWTTQAAFGLSEGIYMIGVCAAGIAIANGSTGSVDVKASAGIDTYAMKILHGDWCYFLDTVNAITRLISPQGFIAGRLANSNPQDSSLNKPLYGIVGTQMTNMNRTYSQAELTLLGQAGLDVIANPCPGGNYFGARFGQNTSSSRVIHQDTYTRITNYIAKTLNAALGIYVGQNQTPTLRREAASSVSAFFDSLWGPNSQNMIGNSRGTVPYSVKSDNDNNPQNRVQLGVMQQDVRVTYLSVVEHFVVNVTAGQSVEVTRASVTQLAAAAA